MNTTLMKEAYSMLYQMENHLRLIIKTNMQNNYGHHWVSILYEKRDEQTSYFHELIAFFGKYPHDLTHFKTVQLKLLQQLIPVRNKIAHSHLITQTEYQLLEQCYQFVIKQPVIKPKKASKKIKDSVLH
ncbi:hypothetical protein E1I69_05825 [Bacillus timonensis]|uniref:Swt1-like HEPN domain-containing protein n=1 Tax=Bacillus timonensis TaxID=1033734 RepID=A0A4S3PW08_9BACI|nr:hypothetical protein [Bacillus timonensis]THE14017.1 hypothetical protein E1I69_05825 [Bacillus timonensis]